MKDQNFRDKKGFLDKILGTIDESEEEVTDNSELIEEQEEEDTTEEKENFKEIVIYAIKDATKMTIKLALICIVVFVVYFNIPVIKAFCTNEKTICRNLNSIFYRWGMYEDPEERNVAWDSEIPSFVETDLYYADKYGLEISYEYYGTKMSVYSDSEGKPEIVIRGPKAGYDSYYITNFSMYISSEGGIVVYGKETTYDREFGRILITDDFYEESYFDTLTYDKNIPFNVDVPRYECVSVAEYTYIVDLKEDGTCSILWYKDGVLEETGAFPELVEKYDAETGIFITKKNEVYVSFVKMNDKGKPIMIFSYVDKIDPNGWVEKDSYFSLWIESLFGENNVQLPLLVKNNEYYTLLPEDWDTYCAYASASSEKLQEDVKSPNYNVSLVKLKDNFISAEFLASSISSKWYAYLRFDIGGVTCGISYTVNGYDGINVKISEEDENALTKKVTSVKEFWEHIEKIRSTFEKYYDSPNNYSSFQKA